MFASALRPYQGRLLVACSGGADSMALAHAVLTRPDAESTPRPILVYIDHGLRAEAAAEADLVLALANAHGAQGIAYPVEVAEQASLEAAAREARYEALTALAEEHSADWILLGHTASDQVETVLMRILRGTGLVGLAGMPQVRERFARPLLKLRRQDTERYCEEQGLNYCEDAMNRDLRFTRSRLRFHWLPMLREENPKIDEALLGLASAARDHREVLDWAAEEVLRKSVTQAGGLFLDAEFQSLPSSLATRVLVRHAEMSGIRGLERRHLLEMLEFARGEAAGTRSLSLPGAHLKRSYDLLEWNPIPPTSSRAQPEAIAGYGWRHWQAGDRMRPERLKGRSRKLSDLYADGKIPKELRSGAWVLERRPGGEIVWSEHVGRAFDCELSEAVCSALGTPLGQDADESAK